MAPEVELPVGFLSIEDVAQAKVDLPQLAVALDGELLTAPHAARWLAGGGLLVLAQPLLSRRGGGAAGWLWDLATARRHLVANAGLWRPRS